MRGTPLHERRVQIYFHLKFRKAKIHLDKRLGDRESIQLQRNLNGWLGYIQQHEIQEGTQLEIEILDEGGMVDITRMEDATEIKRNKVDWVSKTTFFKWRQCATSIDSMN